MPSAFGQTLLSRAAQMDDWRVLRISGYRSKTAGVRDCGSAGLPVGSMA